MHQHNEMIFVYEDDDLEEFIKDFERFDKSNEHKNLNFNPKWFDERDEMTVWLRTLHDKWEERGYTLVGHLEDKFTISCWVIESDQFERLKELAGDIFREINYAFRIIL